MGATTAQPVAVPAPESSAQAEEQGSAVSSEERHLVRRAQNGDMRAIEALIGRYQRKVYAIAYQMCGLDKTDAQDMAQEALLHVFKNIKRFEGRSQFSTWLHRVAVNACLDMRRRRRRWARIIFPWRSENRSDRGSGDPIESIPAPVEADDPHARVSEKELKQELKAALAMLSANQRVVFQLKTFQELSIAEIAQTTGMAEGTVKSHLFRANQAVRAHLRRWVEP
ncbi:MAG: sigma-70 family RNA polymerase sigma factor [Desulfobacterales bacterium]|jgi:RNA polymerase sigma-70 factor (ECF subfamily)|nr:sigma-70 family RNA polymerase sigma factor [Desulfobacterales bacterium]